MKCCGGGCWGCERAAGRARRGERPGGGVACLEIAGRPRRQRPAPRQPVYLCCELAPRSPSPCRGRSRSPAVVPALRVASLSAALIAAVGGQAATRLQSEWAAQIYWGVRGDASVIGDLLAQTRGGGRGRRAGEDGGTREMRVVASEKFWVNWLFESQREQHVHKELAAIKQLVVLALLQAHARTVGASGMTPLSLHSPVTLQS